MSLEKKFDILINHCIDGSKDTVRVLDCLELSRKMFDLDNQSDWNEHEWKKLTDKVEIKKCNYCGRPLNTELCDECDIELKKYVADPDIVANISKRLDYISDIGINVGTGLWFKSRFLENTIKYIYNKRMDNNEINENEKTCLTKAKNVAQLIREMVYETQMYALEMLYYEKTDTIIDDHYHELSKNYSAKTVINRLERVIREAQSIDLSCYNDNSEAEKQIGELIRRAEKGIIATKLLNPNYGIDEI